MEATVEQKLQALWDLQQLHSKIDRIKTVRGELPMEVRDLEDEIAGLETRKEKSEQDIDDHKKKIEEKQTFMKECEALIKKYEKQQMNVKNSREYDAINKEVELQNLEIKVAEKKIKELEIEITGKAEVLDKSNEILEERKKDLAHKKTELDSIIAETEKEEAELAKKADKAEKMIEERLINAYNKIRENAKNGLAVVAVERESCAGCFNAVPPQRKLELRQRKKIIVCEHCGRILVDDQFAEEAAGVKA